MTGTQPGSSAFVGDDAASPFAGTTRIASPAAAVTLVEGQTFCLSDAAGDVSPEHPHGLFVLDTRVISEWRLTVDAHPLEALATSVTDPYMGEFVGSAHPRAGEADAHLVVFRERSVGVGMRERISLTNHGLTEVRTEVELFCDVDFAGLFEVKESRVETRARPVPEPTTDGILFTELRRGVRKEVKVTVHAATLVRPGRVTWAVVLAPRETWETCVEVTVSQGGDLMPPRFTCAEGDHGALPATRLAMWRATMPSVDTDADDLARAIQQGVEDLGALRIFDPDHPEIPILAAGAPWFMTVFGRDSLLTAWMALIADRSLAQGVLETLARFQGKLENPVTEEEPGKILHEMRFGSAGGFALRNGEVYYGTIDATPLFVMLLGELLRWGSPLDTVRELVPFADRALAWIDAYGDRDGDGYVEYARTSSEGLVNQGWKDSWDAIRHADGRLAEGPIALCEVQGYVYAARLARADIADALGDPSTAREQRAAAERLRARFNADFWIDRLGTYALALDGEKRPISAATSNVGHCLWTGIVAPEHAPQVAARLLGDDMFSGWGIRTVSTETAWYNPVSYHNGSVWPHDNAICIAGLANYGFVDAAHRVIEGQLAVASRLRGRLPELFSGFVRGRPATPAVYPTSCSPQAWAAASPLVWLRVLLGLRPNAPAGSIGIDPRLPASMARLSVSGIDVGRSAVSIAVDADGFEVEVDGEGLEVVSPRSRRR